MRHDEVTRNQATAHGGGHGHDPHLAHHFETPQQQFESGKLGMWLFLATEILLFTGLFCAYAVYRANHPEIFVYAHQFLDKTLGGINTLVLIFSSFTMAWAVRAAQLGERKRLVGLLAITLVCGFGFLGIKAVEYEHKWKHGLLWGRSYNPAHEEHGAGGVAPGMTPSPGADAASHAAAPVPSAPGSPGTATGAPANPLLVQPTDRSQLPPAATGPAGLAAEAKEDPAHHAAETAPKNVQVFFSIYFLMTGLHGLHVVAGMVCIGWILLRSMRNEFGPNYYLPVDNVGLYWHLVDLIWIYLFPLLYLIH